MVQSVLLQSAQSFGVSTLSQVTKRAVSSLITHSRSSGPRSTKFVKIEPVVGLYTSYSSCSSVAIVLAFSGSVIEPCAVSFNHM